MQTSQEHFTTTVYAKFGGGGVGGGGVKQCIMGNWKIENGVRSNSFNWFKPGNLDNRTQKCFINGSLCDSNL